MELRIVEEEDEPLMHIPPPPGEGSSVCIVEMQLWKSDCVTASVFEVPDTYTAPPRSMEEQSLKMHALTITSTDDRSQDIAPPLPFVQYMFVKVHRVKVEVFVIGICVFEKEQSVLQE